MIHGVVNARGEAVVRLRVRGPGGVELDLDAVVDSGFTGSLVLATPTVAALGLVRESGGGAVLADAFTKTFGIVGAVAGAANISGAMAPVIVGVVLAVVLALVGVSVFSGLLDQAALLQTALNVETNGAELVNEMRIMNKYLRQIVPFLKDPPGK